MSKQVWLTLCLLSGAVLLSAQNMRLKKANDYFNNGNYAAAIPLYQEVLQQNDAPQAMTNLAESYRQIGDYQRAVQWYTLVMGLPNCQPQHQLRYGLALLRLGECDTAERWFSEYLKRNPYDERKPQLLDACAYTERLLEKNAGQVSLQPININTSGGELAPAYYRDGLVFTQLEKPKPNEQPYSHLVQTSRLRDSMMFTSPSPFFQQSGQQRNEGIASFTPGQNEIFFTRNRYVNEGIQQLEIVTARLLPQGMWSQPEVLPFCSDQYSVAHPTVSADGQRLYFSSDMPGGFGGKDIYLSVRSNGRWTHPVNLGPNINTEGDEVFPQAAPTGQLYFASDGHLGLGKQDLFRVTEQEDGLWSRPENLGAPFNSGADDIAIAVAADGQSGFLTSNRAGGEGEDDLYFFEYSGYLVQVDIFDLKSGEPLPGATLYSSQNEEALQADAEGRVAIRFPDCTNLTASLADYEEKKLNLCPEELNHNGDTVFIAMGLMPVTDKFLEGVVFDQTLGRPVAEVEIMLQSTSCDQQLRAFSDADGRFNLQLQPGCCYSLKARHPDYQSYQQREQICPQNDQKVQYTNIFLQPSRYYGEAARPTAQGGPEQPGSGGFEGFDLASSTTLHNGQPAYRLNVYYDVGRSSVQPGSVPELFRLRDLLLRKPEIKVEIHSHTDATGSEARNQRISQKRADQIVRYLVSEGIDRSRLIPIGHGESRPLNGCTDGVPCQEWQHQENRRTEFVVLKN